MADDATKALFVWTRLRTTPARNPGRIRWPGLDPRAHHRVRLREDWGALETGATLDQPWLKAARTGVDLPGAVLTHVGVHMPARLPQQSALFDVAAADRAAGLSRRG